MDNKCINDTFTLFFNRSIQHYLLTQWLVDSEYLIDLKKSINKWIDNNKFQ